MDQAHSVCEQAPVGDPLQNFDADAKQQLLLKLLAESPEMPAFLTAPGSSPGRRTKISASFDTSKLADLLNSGGGSVRSTSKKKSRKNGCQ